MITIADLIDRLENAIEKGVDPNTPVRVLNDVFTEHPIVDLDKVKFQKDGRTVRVLKNATEVVLYGVEDDDNPVDIQAHLGKV